MKRYGLIISFLAIALQWLIVASFISHAYEWWIKTHDPFVVTAGITGTIAMFIGSGAAIIFSSWVFVKTPMDQLKTKTFAFITALSGMAGQLVYFGLASTGVVWLVHR